MRRTALRSSCSSAERLERRRLLAAVSWDGGAGTFAWSDAANWSNDLLPTPADDVTIDIPAAITVTLSSGTRSVNSLTAAEDISITGGTLSVAAPSTFNGAVTISGTGTLTGAGNFTLNGITTWTAGMLSGAGTAIIGATGSLVLNGPTNVNLRRNLTNNGSINWAGAQDLLMTNSVITNNATISHTGSDESVFTNTAGSNLIINAGTISKTGGGTLRTGVPLVNNGEMTSTAGTLTVSGGLTHNGSIMASGSTLNFNSAATYAPNSTVSGGGAFIFSAGTHTLEPTRYAPVGTTAFQGTANVIVNTTLSAMNSTISGTVTFNTPMSIANANISAAATFNQPVEFTGTTSLGGAVVANSITTTSFSSLVITSGTVTLTSAAALDADSFTLAGTLSTPANLTINVAGNIQGGGLIGGGSVSILPAATVNVTAGATTLSKNIDNDGAINMSSVGDINFASCIFTNDGTINFSGNGADMALISGLNAFINNGTLNKTGTTSSTIRVPVNNNGTITVIAGAIGFVLIADEPALLNNGATTIAAGATLRVGTLASGPAGTVSGAGIVQFTGGTSELNPVRFATTGDISFGGGTVTVNVPRTQTAATTIDGTVTFNQPATFNSTLRVNTLTTFNSDATFSGAVTIGGSGRIDVNTPSPMGVTLPSLANVSPLTTPPKLGGTGVVTIAGAFVQQSGWLIDGSGLKRLGPAGTLDIFRNTIFECPQFQNQGTITLSDYGRIGLLNVTLTNDGVIQMSGPVGQGDRIYDAVTTTTGNVLINNGTISTNVFSGIYAIGTRLLNNGILDGDAGILRLSGTGNEYSVGSTIRGDKIVEFFSGTHLFQADSIFGTIDTLYFAGGVCTFAVPTTLSRGTLTGGTLTGASITIGGTFGAISGTIDEGGSFIVLAGSTVEQVGNGIVTFSRPVTNNGTWTFGPNSRIDLSNTVLLNNGTFHVNAGGSGTYINKIGNGLFRNVGYFHMTGGWMTFGALFENVGLFDHDTGHVVLIGGFADGTFDTLTGVWDLADAFQSPPVKSNVGELIIRRNPNYSGFVTALSRNYGKIELLNGIDLTISPPGTGAERQFFNSGQIYVSSGSVLTLSANSLTSGEGNSTIQSEITGPADAQFGKINVTYITNLDSTDGGDSQFQLNLVAGYDPPIGTRFNVVTAASVIGAFDDYVANVTPSGRYLLAGKTATQVYAEIGTTTPPPQIIASSFEYETRQAIVLAFNTDVSAFLSRKDLTLTNLDTSTNVSSSIGSLTYDSGTNRATLTFTSLLPDAAYRLSVNADDIANAAGVPLTTPLTLDFFVFAGDVNRDRTVNFDDLLILAQNYGQSGRTFSQGNINYSADGKVDFDDLLLVAQRYGTSRAMVASVDISKRRSHASDVLL